MKKLCVVLMLVLASLAGQAQTTDSVAAARATPAAATPGAKSTFKQQMLARYGERDTARAVINLFYKRRNGGAAWLLGTAIALVRVAISPASETTTNGVVVEEENTTVPALLVGAVFGGYGASKLVRFSNSRLEQTLQNYDRGKPLPKWVRRRLKPRFFRAS